MTHVTQQSPTHPVAVALASGKLSVNAQVAGYKGDPNPTLLSLMSTGQVSIGMLNSTLSFSGWGGE